MAFFLGKDVTLTMSTESNREIGITPAAGNAAQVAVGASVSEDFEIKAGAANADEFFPQITALELNIGAMDEDISYFGMRSQTKAEIKKETTLSLTRKKTDEVMDILFNEVRYGALSGSSAADDGLDQPTTDRGYRLIITVNADQSGGGTDEVITLKGCCIQGHTVTVNTDGTMDETLEFMTYIDPSYGTTADTDAIDATTDL